MAVLKTALLRQTTKNSSCSATQRIPVYTRTIQILTFGPINMYIVSGTSLDGRPPSSSISPHCHCIPSQLLLSKFSTVLNKSNKINEDV